MFNNVILSTKNVDVVVDDIAEKVASKLSLLFFNNPQVLKNDEEFLTIDEAAKLLTLSKQTIYGLVSKSTIPHLKKGKRLYFLKKDLITWILQGKRKTKAELDANIHKIINKKQKD